MRARSNEPDEVITGTSLSPEKGAHVPERTCVLTRTHGTRDALIRLALGPDGQVAPDVRARAPGRGAWIGVTQAALAAALAKGKLKGALSRAFKTGDIVIPADLPARTEAALRRTLVDRLGLEARSGTLLTGSDKIEEAARRLATDPHSPPELRCNAVVCNLDAFHEAFGVTEGDALYRPVEERVRIW